MDPARPSSSRRGRSSGKRRSRSNSRSDSRRHRKSDGGKPPPITANSNDLISATALDALFLAGGKKHGVDGKLRVKASAGKEREVVHAAVMDAFKVHPSPPGASRPQQVLLGVITTAPIETMGVMSALKDPVALAIPVGVTTWDCYVGTLFGVRAVVVKSDQGPSGSHGSINATSFLISQWSVKTIWAVGIALGADPKNQKHGDVLAATAVQVYETREKTGPDGKKNITLGHAPWTVSKELKSVVESTCASWKSGENKGHAGLVVSAPKLLDDAGATTEQLNVVRKAVPNMPVIGGEMEMGGVISVCLGAGVPWGIVKGICDFGGLDKAKSKEWQPLATMNAVAWIGSAIGNGSWIRSIPTPALSALHVMSFDEYMEKKRDGFVGRTELFGKMEAFSGGRVLLIKGEAGIGKSALMSQFVARNEDNGKIMALHFCQFGDGSTLDSERWLRSVTGQIMRWASQHNISIPDEVIGELLDDATPISSRFQAFSHAFPESAPAGTDSVWIIVDSLDEAVQAGGARSGFDIVRAIGRAEFPSWIRIVASTRSDPTVMSALEREIKDVVVMESSSEENMRDIRTWLTTAGGVTKESTLKAVLKASEGNFLYVRQLVVDGDVEKRVNSLPSGLVGIYSARAKALWEDVDEFEGDVPVLSVLVAARAPVPLDLLKVAAKAAAGGRVNVKRIVEYLKSVLDVGRDGAVRVFHKSFVDWCVSVGYEGIKAEIKDGHKGLATAGMGLWESGNVYAVRHTLVHAHEAGQDEQALENVGKQWVWMKLRADLDGWSAVGYDLQLLGATQLGKVISQSSNLSQAHLMTVMSLYADPELKAAIRAENGIVPLNRWREVRTSLLARLVGHKESILSISPAGPGRIATGGWEDTIRVWDYDTAECLLELRRPPRTGATSSLVYSSPFLAAGCGKLVCIWDTQTGGLVAQLKQHKNRIKGLCAPAPGVIVSFGEYNAADVHIWLLGSDGQWSGAPLAMPFHKSGIIAWAALGNGLLATSSGNLILISDPRTGKQVSQLGPNPARVAALAVLPDGRLVSATSDIVRVWPSSHSGNHEAESKFSGSMLRCLATVGNLVVAGDFHGGLAVWRVASDSIELMGQSEGHTGLGGVAGVTVIDDKRFASVGPDKLVCIWSAPDFRRAPPGHRSEAWIGTVLKSDRVVSGGRLGELVVWKPPAWGEECTVERVIEPRGTDVKAVCGVQGGFAWWPKDSPEVKLWSDSDAIVHSLPGVDDSLKSFCTIRGGSLLAWLDSGGVQVWEISARKQLRVIRFKLGGTIAPLGDETDQAAVSCYKGRLLVLNLLSGEILKDLQVGEGFLYSMVAMTPQRVLVVEYSSWTLWDVDLAQERSSVTRSDVMRIYASLGDGNVLVRLRDGRVEVWDALKRLTHRGLAGLEGLGIGDMAWNPTNRTAVGFCAKERAWVAYNL